MRSILTIPFQWLNSIRERGVEAENWPSPIVARISHYNFYLSGVLIFSASRVVVVAGLFFGKNLVPFPLSQPINPDSPWYESLIRWDSGWYAAIMQNGYRYSGDAAIASSTAFYPLYPLVGNVAKAVFGLNETHALLLVATAASAVSAIVLMKFVRNELSDEVALLFLTFFWFSPLSLFFSVAQTEPLFFMFVLLSLSCLRSKRFFLASTAAGLSLATRSTGIVMIPVILWEIWQQDCRPLPERLAKMILYGLVAACGLLSFMTYLWIKFGHPMAFATAQYAWMGGHDFSYTFRRAVTLYPYTHFNFKDGSWFVLYLALIVFSFRHLRSSLSLYGLCVLLLPYFTLNLIQSTDRHIAPCFPALMCLAILCEKRRWFAVALVGTFGALLLRISAMWAQGYPVT